MSLREVTDANFGEAVVQASHDKPVFVKFTASWCGPCKQIAPLLDDLSLEFADSYEFYELDVDENVSTAGSYGVQSIPTMKIFRDGLPVESIVGVKPKSQLKVALLGNR